MTHHLEPSAALETLVLRLDELAVVVGPAAAPRLAAVRGHLTRALGLRAGGDAPGATRAITLAMQELAGLAAHVDPDEAAIMRAVVQLFGGALTRGEAGELERTADVMRARSGATKIESKG